MYNANTEIRRAAKTARANWVVIYKDADGDLCGFNAFNTNRSGAEQLFTAHLIKKGLPINTECNYTK